VWSFKAPSAEELRHGFLWRTTKAMPGRGQIGIFNRSYYEEVLVVRVHPQILETRNFPSDWSRSTSGRSALKTSTLRALRGTEWDCGGEILSTSFQGRAEAPVSGTAGDSGKELKFSSADVKERGFWDAYQDAYERRSGTRRASLRPGMLCRRITNGLRDWWFHTRWWRRCRG